MTTKFAELHAISLRWECIAGGKPGVNLLTTDISTL